MGKLGEDEDEEEESATQEGGGGKEYTDLGLDLREGKEYVTCHASALVMTDEACREVEM